jgi:putative adhesin
MPTFDTPGSVSLQIKLPSGRVVVTTADEPRTTVEVIPLGRRGQDAIDEIEITMEERAGRHVVRIEQRDRFRWGPIQISWGGDFECRVTCPPGTDLDLSGASTDVRVDGELGEVSARTASGDIRLQTVADLLQVKTASGDVSVGTLGGQVTSVSSASTRRSRRGPSPVTSPSGRSPPSSASRRRRVTWISRACKPAKFVFRPFRATSASESHAGRASGSMLRPSPATSVPSSASKARRRPVSRTVRSCRSTSRP